MACLRLVTFLRERPDFKVPDFFLRIARATLRRAPLEYLRFEVFLRDVFLRDVFLRAMFCVYPSARRFLLALRGRSRDERMHADGHRGTCDWPNDVDPPRTDRARKELRSERTRRIHRCAADRTDCKSACRNDEADGKRGLPPDRRAVLRRHQNDQHQCKRRPDFGESSRGGAHVRAGMTCSKGERRVPD